MALLFRGKTAIVTGAGGGLGRIYAIELAKRGCNVICNDVGGDLLGKNTGGVMTASPAQKVVIEINQMNNQLNNGARAIPNYSSVLEGGSIVKQALHYFGSVDILINNAGILRDKSFHKMTDDDWKAVLDVHLNGTFRLTHAAWTVMQEQSYGRIVNVSSGAGLYGNFGQCNYSAAKLGILGLTQSLAKEGGKYGIKVNCIVPIAESRMTATVLPQDVLSTLDPNHIAPMVTYLAHESCAPNGAIYELGGGWYSQVRWQRSQGVKLSKPRKQANLSPNAVSGSTADVPASPEDIAASMDQIGDFGISPSYPASAADALQAMTAAPYLDPVEPIGPVKEEKEESVRGADFSSLSLQSDRLFGDLISRLEEDKQLAKNLVEQIKSSVHFKILSAKDQSLSKVWVLTFKPPEPASVIGYNPSEYEKEFADKEDKITSITCSDEKVDSLLRGNSSPEFAYIKGDIKIKGSMGAVIKMARLKSVFHSAKAPKLYTPPPITRKNE